MINLHLAYTLPYTRTAPDPCGLLPTYLGGVENGVKVFKDSQEDRGLAPRHDEQDISESKKGQ